MAARYRVWLCNTGINSYISPQPPLLPLWQVIDDGDIVPGWEGKIVGWVEDDTGQKALSGYQDQMT